MRYGPIAIGLLLSCCDGAAPKTPGAEMKNPRSFADDVSFLSKHGEVFVLSAPEGGKIAVSAAYQGRVMTSAVSSEGQSLGWIHRAFIESKTTGTAFDNFGGEDRFWLGPEGGQFGLYFPKGAPFAFDAWQTPHEMQEGAWSATEDRPGQITLTRTMKVENWSGTRFDVGVKRTIEVLGRDAARSLAAPASNVPFVAYRSVNTVTNAGKEAWKKESGLLSIWILAMYAPAVDTKVVIPFARSSKANVNDTYFGKVPADRLDVRDRYLVFKCDGVYRSKIGLRPEDAKNVLGSYSPSSKLLTIVTYDGPKPGAPYVNSMWETQKEPYAGDVVNSYNDGSPGEGKPPLGGFYEIETSSPGLALAAGESASHTHTTFHFVGERPELDAISRATLGVALAELEH